MYNLVKAGKVYSCWGNHFIHNFHRGGSYLPGIHWGKGLAVISEWIFTGEKKDRGKFTGDHWGGLFRVNFPPGSTGEGFHRVSETGVF